jgi:Amt family ammonium transporter
VLGVFLLLLGWFGLVLGNPVLSGDVSHERVLFNVLLAGCGGVLASSLYVWFVGERPDLLMIVRGMVASLVAVSASCPFVSGWGALIIGAVAGLLVPLSIYVFEAKFRLDDSTSSLATHGISGLWGLIALGVLADGTSGAGWNGVGVNRYLGVEGQGVSGLLVSSGFQPDWPAQLYAQVVGVVALLILALGIPWLVLTAVNSFKRRMARARSASETAGQESPGEMRVPGNEDS